MPLSLKTKGNIVLVDRSCEVVAMDYWNLKLLQARPTTKNEFPQNTTKKIYIWIFLAHFLDLLKLTTDGETL